MALPTNANNIRRNGTGRVWLQTVGGAGPGYDVGEVEFKMSSEVSEDELKSNRSAAKGTIRVDETGRKASFELLILELSKENLAMAWLGSIPASANQVAGNVNLVAKTTVLERAIDLGHMDIFYTKVTHGVVTGTDFVVGEIITGSTSLATGTVAWFVADSYVMLVNVSGTFVAGETITGGTGSGTAMVSGVETKDGTIVVDAASPTTLYTEGTDYLIDPQYGYLTELDGSIASHSVYVAYDYPALSVDYFWALAAGSVEKKVTIVSDADDAGPRMRRTIHKAKLLLSGDQQIVGGGDGFLTIQGTILLDTSQPVGQRYFKDELIS